MNVTYLIQYIIVLRKIVRIKNSENQTKNFIVPVPIASLFVVRIINILKEKQHRVKNGFESK